MRSIFLIILILNSILPVSAQISPRFGTSTGFKLSVLVSGQEITNIPTLLPLYYKKDTVIDNRTGSADGQFGFSVAYFAYKPVTRLLSLQTAVGFRQRGFIADTKYDPRTGYALLSSLNINRLSNLFVDLGLRLQTVPGRKTSWFASFSNRIDYLIASRLPFWNNENPYRQIEFSPVGQAGFGFRYGPHGRRCFVELEGNPGIMNVLKKEQNLLTQKPVGSFPASPISTYQKIGRNYSVALGLSVEW